MFPFSLLFHAITAVRNRLYDSGMKPVATFDLPIIGVGNLTVGGTGKTPMIERLIRMVGARYKLATVSRGYGRRATEIRLAGPEDDASLIGDEPLQLYRKFGDSVTVAVGADRVLTVAHLLQEREETEVILMDDVFQHRRLKPSFQILLTDYHRLFYKDFLLPAGNLRESKVGARRADVVVVTKCPKELSGEEMIVMEAGIRRYSDKPVFFSTIRYGEPEAFFPSAAVRQEKVVLVSGIASATSLKHYVETNFKMVRHFDYPDHYRYKAEDLQRICAEARAHQACILTTEKDAVKINTAAFRKYVEENPFYFLPIEIEILKNGKDFDQMVFNAIENVSKSQGK